MTVIDDIQELLDRAIGLHSEDNVSQVTAQLVIALSLAVPLISLDVIALDIKGELETYNTEFASFHADFNTKMDALTAALPGMP